MRGFLLCACRFLLFYHSGFTGGMFHYFFVKWRDGGVGAGVERAAGDRPARIQRCSQGLRSYLIIQKFKKLWL